RRGRGAQHHALRGAGARAELGQARLGTAGHDVRISGAQPSRGALQGAGRLCHQRRQHDQAGELHGRWRVLRDAVLCRCRRPSRRHGAGVRAGGAEVLLARTAHRRCVPGPPVPRDVQREGG
ncbi:hypothetical protein KXX24_008070, partial [Aspergillus fumigatus]